MKLHFLRKISLHVSPPQTIFFTFLLLIFLGTILLHMPFCHNQPIDWWQSFLVATSSATTTGMMNIPLSVFSFWGKLVMIVLAQIGGLGLLTILIPFLGLFSTIGLRTYLIAGQQLDAQQWMVNSIYSKKIAKFITVFALISELVGAAICYVAISSFELDESRVFSAIFHSISCFCNLGISIFPKDLEYLMGARLFVATSTVLMLLGSLGFIPLYEIYLRIRRRLLNPVESCAVRFSLQSRIIFWYTPILTICLSAFLIYSQWNDLVGYGWLDKINIGLFNSFAFRCAGFSSFNLTHIGQLTLFVIIVFSFIGSSPGSVGGGAGLKVTTLAVALASVKSGIFASDEIALFERRIPREQIVVAFALLTIYIAWAVLTTFLILLTQPVIADSFLFALFDSIGALTNVGLTVNFYESMNHLGQGILALCMLIGRANSLTFLILLRRNREKSSFKYPEECFPMG